MKKIVVLLPTYNEVDNIEDCVEGVLKQEKEIKGWRVEILIVDGGSSDGTVEKANKLVSKNLRIHLLKVERGLGVGLIKGHLYSIKHLRPQILAQIDSDGQIEYDVLPKLVKTIEIGYNLALGSRFIKGGKNQISLLGRMLSKCSSWFCKIVMGPSDITEFNTLTRAFTPELFKKIRLENLPWKEQTFIIQPAFLNEAILAGAKYKEVPIICRERLKNYSKNKIINYTYDVITYALDAKFKKLGLAIPFFKISRKLNRLRYNVK